MSAAEPFGYWTFNGKNGLAGLDPVVEVLPDGRVVEHPDTDNPAILHEEFIVNALRTSRIARNQFDILFPSLLVEEQARLLGILEERPFLMRLMSDPQTYHDLIQTHDIRNSVRIPKGSTTGGTSTSSSTGTVAVDSGSTS